MPFVTQFPQDLGAIVVVNNDTRLIHQGKGFVHHNLHAVAAGATFDHLIVTPADKDIHMRQWSVQASGGPFSILVYENTTTSNNGTVEPVGNLNRQSTETAHFSLYHTPTVTSVGSLILQDQVNGTNKVGEDASGTLEWVLKKSTKYLFRVISSSVGSENVVFQMFWYEI